MQQQWLIARTASPTRVCCCCCSDWLSQLADWFLALKQGDVRQTHELLRGIISMLPMDRAEHDQDGEEEQLRHKRARSEFQDAGSFAAEPAAEFDVVDDFVLHDEVDESPVTAVMLVPNDIGLVSHIIGKQGVSVQEIKRRTGARVQVERYANVSASVTRSCLRRQRSRRRGCWAVRRASHRPLKTATYTS